MDHRRVWVEAAPEALRTEALGAGMVVGVSVRERDLRQAIGRPGATARAGRPAALAMFADGFDQRGRELALPTLHVDGGG